LTEDNDGPSNTLTINKLNKPPLYGDAIIEIIPGAFTTRLVFGVQQKNNPMVYDETFTVAMPTPALFIAVKQVLLPFMNDEPTLESISDRLNSFLIEHIHDNQV